MAPSPSAPPHPASSQTAAFLGLLWPHKIRIFPHREGTLGRVDSRNQEATERKSSSTLQVEVIDAQGLQRDFNVNLST